jgi:RecB family exonuclease
MSKMAELAADHEQRHIRQSHLCAFLSDYDLCRCDEHCQYKLTTSRLPLGPKLCGKDQFMELR